MGKCKQIKVWINEGDQKICRACTLPILMQWYISEAEDKGKAELVSGLKMLAEKADVEPEEIAEELDRLKEIAPEELRSRFEEFDCTLEVNEEKPEGE
jgi:hypothetical protein